jgi:hypothetical protein
MMADYQLTATDIVIRSVDDAHIPPDPGNRDRAQYNAWIAAGGVPDPCAVAITPPSFLARELLAQFTTDDYTAIQAAVASNPALGLLWTSLLAQGEAPIMTNSDRFRQGWAGLTAAIGGPRAKAIAAAVGIPG